MTQNILTGIKMPFCPGCGHGIIVKSISKTLEKLGYQPNDVVIVSDIAVVGWWIHYLIPILFMVYMVGHQHWD